MQTKVEHLAQAILPQVHSLTALLRDNRRHAINIDATSSLYELHRVCTQLEGEVGHLIGLGMVPSCGIQLTDPIGVSAMIVYYGL